MIFLLHPVKPLALDLGVVQIFSPIFFFHILSCHANACALDLDKTKTILVEYFVNPVFALDKSIRHAKYQAAAVAVTVAVVYVCVWCVCVCVGVFQAV